MQSRTRPRYTRETSKLPPLFDFTDGRCRLYNIVSFDQNQKSELGETGYEFGVNIYDNDAWRSKVTTPCNDVIVGYLQGADPHKAIL